MHHLVKVRNLVLPWNRGRTSWRPRMPAPPANTGYQCNRAFEAGWGGVVWKTIGDPITNVSSRYSALNVGKDRMVGFNNIELISDRAPETNFREIAECKKLWPKKR